MVNTAVFLPWGRARANCDDNCPVPSYLDSTRARLPRGSYGASHISLGEESGTAGHLWMSFQKFWRLCRKTRPTRPTRPNRMFTKRYVGRVFGRAGHVYGRVGADGPEPAPQEGTEPQRVGRVGRLGPVFGANRAVHFQVAPGASQSGTSPSET